MPQAKTKIAKTAPGQPVKRPQIVKRAISQETGILYLEDKKIIKAERSEILKKYKIDGIIRLPYEDFRYLKPKMLLTHFNLQYSAGVHGKTYGIVSILDSGYYDGKKERLPVLDFTKMYKAICLKSANNITYESLKPDDFKHSLRNIKSVAGLKKAMIRRYRKSMPTLTDEEIISLGVSMRELKLL